MKQNELYLFGYSVKLHKKSDNGEPIIMVYVEKNTRDLRVCSFTRKTIVNNNLVTDVMKREDFIDYIWYVRTELDKSIKNRHARVYNTKMLSKYMFGLSNKDWKKFYNNPHVVHFKDDQNPLLERLSLVLDVIPDYKIDKMLFMSLLEKYWPNLIKNYNTAEVTGRIVSYFAELIKNDKLRKITPYKPYK